MLAQVSNGKLELGGLFDSLKVDLDKYKEVINSFKDIHLSLPEYKDFNTGKANWDAIAKSIEGCDETALSYFKTLDDGKGTINNQSASVEGLSEYLKKAGNSFKFAAVKATLLNAALNAGIFLIASLVIQGVVKIIDNLAHSAEHCKERVDELMSSYKSALEAANNNAKTVESLATRYEELSKGVNNLGQTFGLTTEEATEYHEICNQIADMFPTLISGYDSEGNAILSLKGNVEELSNAYKEAQQKAYSLLISGEDAKDIIQNWNNISNPNKSAYIIGKRNELNNLLSMSYDEFRLNGAIQSKDIHDALGIDTYDYFTITEDEFKDIRNRAKALVQTYQAEIDSALQDIQTLANAYLMTNEDYAQLEETSKNAASIIVNSLNENIVNGFEDAEDVGQYVVEIVGSIKDNPEIQDALMNLFQLDTSEMNPEDAKALVDQYIGYIARVLGENTADLKIRLGFDDIDDLYNNYSSLLNDAAKRASGVTIQDIRHQTGNYEKYQEIYDAIDKFATENSINTQDEIAYFYDALEEANYDIDKAFELYLSKIQDSLDGDNKTTSTISDSVSQIAQQLKPQFDELANTYKSIFTADGMNLEIVDNSMLEGLRKSFAEIEEEIGVTFNASLLNGFFDTLSDGTSTAEEVHDAFNDLASAYFYSTDTLSHLNAETAESIKQQLQQMGVVNSEEIVDHYLQLTEAESELLELQNQLADAKKELAESSNTGEYETAKGRINNIYKQIEAYYAEKGATEELRLALFNLQLQQANLSISSIDSASSVTALLRLAEAAGLSAEYIEKLVYLQELFNQYNATTNSEMQSAIYAQIISTKQSLEDGLEAPELEIDFPSGTDSGAGSAGKDAASEYMDAFNAEFDRLKFLRDNGIITEKEYLDQLRILYEKYFKDREEYLKEYVEYEREYLNGLKDLYEDVLGGITNLLDDQIDKIEEKRDAKIDALEEEQEARNKALEQQKEQLDLQIEEIEAQIEGKNAAIDVINDEIDAIKEANDERQRQIDLQKAQYDLERMQNQHTILQYSEDQGMHYVTDTSGIRDAKQAVDDAKTEIEIANKEKQISVIEDEISLLEQRKSILSGQQDDLDAQMNALDEYYQKLVENTEAYYSALIQPVESYKAQFEDIGEIESSALVIEQLQSLGYSVDDILSHSASTLENFKSNYLGILGDLYSDNTQMLGAVGQASGLQGSDITGYLSQTQQYINDLSKLDLSSTQTAIDSANSGIHSFADGAVLATVNITNMASTTTHALYGSKKEAGMIQQFSELLGIISESADHVANINNGLDELNGKVAECTIKVNIETNGNASLVGKSNLLGSANLNSSVYGNTHVEGTAKLTGDWGVKEGGRSLVGEEGREIVVYPNGIFKTVGDYGAEFVDIPKNSVVFNHQQTEELLKNGHISSRGKAYANGTASNGKVLTPDGHILRPIEPGDRAYELQKAFEPLLKKIDGNLDYLTGNVRTEHSKQMENMINQLNTTNVVNNNKPSINIGGINITCPGITSKEVAQQVGIEMNNMFKGLHLDAMQQSMMR